MPTNTGEIWSGLCGYWTDDWDKLANRPGIPLCPGCGAPGFVQPEAEWWKQVDAYEAAGASGYRKTVEADKEKCSRVKALKVVK